MNVCESLAVTAKILPDHVAVVFGESRFTYRELNSLSISAAGQLQECGVGPGDRVALMLPNAPSFPIWYYAVLRLGAIAVSISTRLAAAEVAFVVSDCEAKVFVASESAFGNVSGQLPENMSAKFSVDDGTGNLTSQDAGKLSNNAQSNDWYHADPDEAALILYTSGTTGFPKGATLSHGNVRSNVCAFNHLCQMQSEDRVLLAVPLFHCFGQNALLNSVLNVGGTIILQQRFDLNESRRLIEQHQVTQLYGVPMMFGLLLESCTPQELASVNYCFSAAATLPIQISRDWQSRFGQPIYEGYGLTETSPFATYNHRCKFKPNSIGMPIDSVEIKIVDTETGENCPPGQLGEIAIRGPNVMLGYWNREEETATAIRDGWFYSGDIGQVDDEGYLFIVDRVKDMITVGGLKVFPAEVERVLLDWSTVFQAAVVGVPDPVFGELVCAFLVMETGLDQEAELSRMEQFLKSNLGNYKIPRRLIVIDELPRNASGKILKTRLRELAAEEQETNTGDAAQQFADRLSPPTLRGKLNSTFESERLRVAIQFLQGQIQEICQLVEQPAPESSFIDAGLDSLAIVDLSAQLQMEVGPQPVLPPTLLFDHPRICDLAEYLVSTLSEESASMTASEKQPESRQQLDLLRAEVESMSEEEALAELKKELG